MPSMRLKKEKSTFLVKMESQGWLLHSSLNGSNASRIVRSILLGEAFIACSQEEAQEYVEELKTVSTIRRTHHAFVQSTFVVCRRLLQSLPAWSARWRALKKSALPCALPSMPDSAIPLDLMMRRSDQCQIGQTHPSNGCIRAGLQVKLPTQSRAADRYKFSMDVQRAHLYCTIIVALVIKRIH